MDDINIGNEQTLKIAQKNDDFRKAGRWMVTPTVLELINVQGLFDLVRDYSDFDEDNDPYGEHDFGSLTWESEKVFWKIDYYDLGLSHWQDPLSPDCQRVLTVYLASEH